MIFKIDKNIFLGSIQKVQSVIEKKITVPILSNVQIVAANGTLTIIATDMEVSIRDVINADIEKEGSITVSAQKLFEVLKELPEDVLTFNVQENNWILITCRHAEFKLVGISDEDFPKIPEIEDTKFLSISTEILDLLTHKTIYAVSYNENRHVLNGVLFQVDENNLRAVATDGHRLAFLEVGNPEPEVLTSMEVIIPSKGINEIRRMLKYGNDKIELGLKKDVIVFRLNQEIVFARLVEGNFPNYSSVINVDPVTIDVKIEKNAFFDALRRVSLFSDLKARGVKLQFEKNQLSIMASTPEYGEAKDEIDIEYEGESFKISYNVNYLIDMLKTMDSEFVQMLINDLSGPTIFKPVNVEDYTYISVIMPMLM